MQPEYKNIDTKKFIKHKLALFVMENWIPFGDVRPIAWDSWLLWLSVCEMILHYLTLLIACYFG